MAQKKPKSGKNSGKTMRDFALNGVTYKVEYDDPSEVENPEIQKLDVQAFTDMPKAQVLAASVHPDIVFEDIKTYLMENEKIDESKMVVPENSWKL